MYKEKLQAYFEAHKEEILKDISDVCAIRSVREDAKEGMPFGEGCHKALMHIMDLAKSLGLFVRNFDGYVMTADINNKPSKLAILAHLDVVHEGKDWTVCKPYEPVIKDGRIYGRGTADDKGPAVMALWALKAVKDLGIELSSNVRVILGTDEECGSSDLAYYSKIEEYPPMSFSPDSSYPVTNIEKGGLSSVFESEFEESAALPRVISIKGGNAGNIVPQECEIILEGISLKDAEKYFKVSDVKYTAEEKEGKLHILVTGQSAHASTPHLGVNAVTAAVETVCSMPLAPCKGLEVLKGLNSLIPHGDFLGKALGVAQKDDLSGELTLNLGVFEYTPAKMTGKIDSRAPICANEDNMSKIVYTKMAEKGIILANTKMRKPHHTPADCEFVKTLNSVYEDYSGKEGGCVAIGGGTYVHNIEGGVAFGCSMPGTENNMHGPDESAVIDELMMSGCIFADVIIKLCK